ncbi:MAG: hypothetical protein U1F66_11055 [bacterium]
MKYKALASLLVLIAVVYFPLAARAEIKGTFKGNGKDATLAYLNARKGEPFSGEDTVVLTFTEKDPGADKKPDMKALFGDYGSALVVKITKTGKLIGTEVSHAALSKRPFSSIGTMKLEGFAWDATGVSGKLSMPAPDEFFGDTWQVNLEFKAPLQ